TGVRRGEAARAAERAGGAVRPRRPHPVGRRSAPRGGGPRERSRRRHAAGGEPRVPGGGRPLSGRRDRRARGGARPARGHGRLGRRVARVARRRESPRAEGQSRRDGGGVARGTPSGDLRLSPPRPGVGHRARPRRRGRPRRSRTARETRGVWGGPHGSPQLKSEREFTSPETRGVWGGPQGTPQLKSEREFTSRERRNGLTLRGNACYGHLLIPSRPSLSIFFPAYNDAGTIASLALVAHMTARQVTGDYEVIVVDDGS